jgi:hypothetical protein
MTEVILALSETLLGKKEQLSCPSANNHWSLYLQDFLLLQRMIKKPHATISLASQTGIADARGNQ